MNGEQESSPLDKRVAEVDKMLEDYEKSLGLPLTTNLTIENEATRLLSVGQTEIRRMTGLECAESATILFNFAFSLQRATNREQGRINWAERSIMKMIAPRIKMQSAATFEERKLLAIKENDLAEKLSQITNQAQLRADRIAFLSTKVENLARSFGNLQQTKRGS